MEITSLSKVLPKTTLHSRIHPLRSFTVPLGTCFVKRDDELGFGVSGTKTRKYLSFLPYFLKEKPDEAVIIGSAYSNHVLSLAQLMRENAVDPILFLLGDSKCKMQGNLLYSAIVAGSKNIHWVSRSRWHDIDTLAAKFADERAKANVKAKIVPKGANCAEALPGALTLALDILRNEEEYQCEFDHLMIDSGTGITSCALLLAFAYLRKKTFLHIVQVAGNKEEFEKTLAERKKDFERLLKDTLPSPVLYKLYTPSITPRFGAVNATIFNTVADLAQKEGFLTDPVFTAKLFYEGKKIIQQEKLEGNILFIHSGGGLGLTGFQEQMAKISHSKNLR